MPDIPQEVREAAANWYSENEPDVGNDYPLLIAAGAMDNDSVVQALHAMFLAGKRAGMERAAEIAKDAPVTLPLACGVSDGASIAIRAIAQAIRSEADGHG